MDSLEGYDTMSTRYQGIALHAIRNARGFLVYRGNDLLATVTGLEAEQVGWMCQDLTLNDPPSRAAVCIERLLAWKVGGNDAYLRGRL